MFWLWKEIALNVNRSIITIQKQTLFLSRFKILNYKSHTRESTSPTRKYTSEKKKNSRRINFTILGGTQFSHFGGWCNMWSVGSSAWLIAVAWVTSLSLSYSALTHYRPTKRRRGRRFFFYLVFSRARRRVARIVKRRRVVVVGHLSQLRLFFFFIFYYHLSSE